MIEIIGDKGRSKFDPDLANELNKKVEDEKRREQLEEKLKPKQETIVEPKNNSEIQNFSDYWTIPNVKYLDEIVKIDLAKELLDIPEKNGYEMADAHLHYSIFKALYNSDNPETEIKEFLRKSFGKGITTSTDIEYNPVGDFVIHNSISSNLSNRYIESLIEITGPNEYIIDSTNPQKYNLLLGSNKLQEIHNVFEWLFGGNIFGWFLTDKKGMRKKEIRNVKFLADSGGINLLCMGKIDTEFRALGMRYSSEKTL